MSRNQSLYDPSEFIPTNTVTSATLSTVPAVGTVSPSLNAGVSAALIGSAASSAASTYPNVVLTGYGLITDATGNVNAGIGVLGKTPQQLEAAGILKPGSAALVTGLVQRGMNVESAMTNNLFTGVTGAENLKAYINNVTAQASAQLINLQQAQTAMTMAGAIVGTEGPDAISGIVNAASQVGIKSTLAYLQNSANISKSITNSSGRTAGSITTGIGAII